MTDDEIKEIFGTASELWDKDSSAYRQAAIKNGIIRDSLDRQPPDPLNQALSEANHIDGEKKDKYIAYAELYTESLEDNIFRNQFDLHKYYPKVSIDEWNDFLQDRIVSTYINKHKRTLLKSAAEDNLANPLAKNKRDNLQLIKNIEAQEQSEANKNICIIRIPDIYDEEEVK